MDENKNEVMENTESTAIDVGDGTVTFTPDSDAPQEDNQAGKLGLAILGVGAAAIVGGSVALYKKIKHKKADKDQTEEEPKKEETAKEPKPGKIRGRKLSAKERIFGHVYKDDVPKKEEKNEEEPATEAE